MSQEFQWNMQIEFFSRFCKANSISETSNFITWVQEILWELKFALRAKQTALFKNLFYVEEETLEKIYV